MRIYTGDIREVVPRLILAETVDCIIADCPYGETSLGWDRWVEGWPAIVRRTLKPTGSMWVFGSTRMFMEHATDRLSWGGINGSIAQAHRAPAPSPSPIRNEADLLAERDALFAMPRNYGQTYFGDPLPGRSALDRKRELPPPVETGRPASGSAFRKVPCVSGQGGRSWRSRASADAQLPNQDT